MERAAFRPYNPAWSSSAHVSRAACYRTVAIGNVEVDYREFIEASVERRLAWSASKPSTTAVFLLLRRSLGIFIDSVNFLAVTHPMGANGE